jgi:serine/threonine protein kinase
MNIAHCDIKPENILVVNTECLKIKICDVGSCKIIDKEAENESTIKGTLSFLAP